MRDSTVDRDELVTQAHEAAVRQAELLASVTHDLRNPLGAVLVHAALIARTSQSPTAGDSDSLGRVQRWAEAIQRAATRMNELLADVVDFATCDSGDVLLVQAHHPVEPVIEEVVAAIEPFAASRGVVVAGSGESSGLFDRARIAKALIRIAINSIEHAPRESLVIVRGGSSGGELVFSVHDEAATSAQQLERAFAPARKPGSPTRAVGLGLAIARFVAEAHGGRAEAVTSPSGGTDVRLVLPAR